MKSSIQSIQSCLHIRDRIVNKERKVNIFMIGLKKEEKVKVKWGKIMGIKIKIIQII
jgi:hypothetical protein